MVEFGVFGVHKKRSNDNELLYGMTWHWQVHLFTLEMQPGKNHQKLQKMGMCFNARND